jgi:hypothetical protein
MRGKRSTNLCRVLDVQSVNVCEASLAENIIHQGMSPADRQSGFAAPRLGSSGS